MVCHHLAKFGGHRYCSSRDMFLICDVTLQNQMIEAINDFMVRSSSRYVIILPSLVTIDNLVVEIQDFYFIT